MSTPPLPPTNGTLKQPDAEAERDALRQWRRIESDQAGPRGGMPRRPDDVVAYLLLEAAEAAEERGERQHSINILKLVIRDYRQSQEAAFARSVIDKLPHRSR